MSTSTSSPVGSGSNPQTLSRMNAERPAPDGGSPWRNGGRIRALIRGMPIATLTIMLACWAVYFYQLTRDEATIENCISYEWITQTGQYQRIFTNAWLHNGFFHIALNMMAFYQIGGAAEEVLGTITMFGLTIIFPIFIGLDYLLIESIAASVMKDESYLYSCAVGYSGVIFAFLVVEIGLAYARGERTRNIMGMCNVSILLYPVIILLAISLIMPNISFAGHLSGIIIGLLYVRGMLLLFSLPRQWMLAIQRCLPQWLLQRPGWKDVPESDPFQQYHPEFCQSRSFCPDAPNMDGGCLALLNLCLEVIRLRRVNRVGGGGAGHSLQPNGGRGQSRLLQSQPSSAQSSNLSSAPPVNRPPSPSQVGGSQPARPSSTPIAIDHERISDGHYARLNDVEDDVEAQLLAARSSPTSSVGSQPGATSTSDLELKTLGNHRPLEEL